MNLRSFNLYRNYSNSFTLSNASELFFSRTPKNHIPVPKEKEYQAVGCLRPLRNVKLGIFSSYSRSAVKKCTKEREHVQSCRLPIQPIAFLTFSLSSHPWNLTRARSIQPKFQPVRPGKEDHLKRWTIFFETFPVGPNRSIEFWTEISGHFG